MILRNTIRDTRDPDIPQCSALREWFKLRSTTPPLQTPRTPHFKSAVQWQKISLLLKIETEFVYHSVNRYVCVYSFIFADRNINITTGDNPTKNKNTITSLYSFMFHIILQADREHMHKWLRVLYNFIIFLYVSYHIADRHWLCVL